MLFDHKYPYTDFHELNLDWILSKMRELDSTISEFTTLNKLQWCGTWDISKSYSAWSLVEDGEGNGYVSTGPVPAGIQLDNKKYWQKVANYSALYSAFEQRIELLEDGEAEIKTALNDEKTARETETEARKTADSELSEKLDSLENNTTEALKEIPTNLGVNVVYSEHANDWDSTLNDYLMQGACYDSRREYVYVGCAKDETDGKIVVLNKNLEYVKTVAVTAGGHMNDLDYRADTDEIWCASNVGNYVKIYNASDFSFKRNISFDSITEHWPITVTHDENNNMLISFYWSGTDVRLYKFDSNGNNGILIGNLYDSALSTFNNYSWMPTSGGEMIYTGTQYKNGYIYIVEQYAIYTPRWIPCRLLAVNVKTGAIKCAVDYMVPEFEEPECIFSVGDTMYVGGRQLDWTDGKSIIWNLKIVKESMVSPSPHNTEITWTPTMSNNSAQTYRLTRMPSGKFLVIVNSYTVPYESGRVIYANLKLPNGEIKRQINPTQYLNETFNIVGFYNSHDPWTLILEANTISTSSYTLTFKIQLIELSGYVPYSETTA